MDNFSCTKNNVVLVVQVVFFNSLPSPQGEGLGVGSAAAKAAEETSPTPPPLHAEATTAASPEGATEYRQGQRP